MRARRKIASITKLETLMRRCSLVTNAGCVSARHAPEVRVGFRPDVKPRNKLHPIHREEFFASRERRWDNYLDPLKGWKHDTEMPPLPAMAAAFVKLVFIK